MKFYHLADIHLGVVPDKHMPWGKMRAAGIYEQFYRILDQARRDDVDMIFICGDLFHRQPLKRELKEINYHFSKAATTEIFIIAGNHDCMGKDSNYLSYPFSSNVHLFKPGECQYFYSEKNRAYIYGFSYDRREMKEPLYDHLRPISGHEDCSHILLAHGGDFEHIPVDYRSLEQSGFDYIAMGHIHKPWKSASGRIAYSGSMEPTDRNDEGMHGFIRGEIDARRLRTEFIPWARYQYVPLTVNADGEMSWEQLKDMIAHEMQRTEISDGQENIFKVVLSGQKDAELVYDPEEVYRLGKVVSVTDEMEPDYDFERIYVSNQGNLIGQFIDRVDKLGLNDDAAQKVLCYGLRALYRTGGDI